MNVAKIRYYINAFNYVVVVAVVVLGFKRPVITYEIGPRFKICSGVALD